MVDFACKTKWKEVKKVKQDNKNPTAVKQKREKSNRTKEQEYSSLYTSIYPSLYPSI
jgi:hypothetical protein